MPRTPNHDYNVPNAGAEDWHIPLNENFEQYDTDIEIRDEASNRSNYDPKPGAKFVETDTGLVYQGDGSAWVPTLAYGRHVPAGSADEPGNSITGSPENSVGSDVFGATIGGGGTASGSEVDHLDTFENSVTEPYGTVTGGTSNSTEGLGGTVSGGGGNRSTGLWTTVGGGKENVASGDRSTIGGGAGNTASGIRSTVAGGSVQEATSSGAAIGGGTRNKATDWDATVGGGNSNHAGAIRSTIGGGARNETSGMFATVPGGQENVAGGSSSFAAGAKANARHDRSFVWNDGSDGVESTGAGQFLVNAGGGVGFGTTAPNAPVDVASENNWDLDNNDGDLRVGDDQYRLAMGVATGGGGAGQCNVRAKGGIEELTLGAGTNGPTVRVNPDSVTVEGDLSVSGNKNFVQSVDTDDGEKDVYYSAVEAGTPHTEVSGVAELDDGRADIDLPEHFSLVTDPDEPLMVQVTPHARERVHPQVTERSTHRIVVEEFEGETGGYEVSYTVKGTREGYADEAVVREPGER